MLHHWMIARVIKLLAVEVTRFILAISLLVPIFSHATPANKAAFIKYYNQYLPTNLNSCTTCHLPAKLDHPPENLDEFPHNDFGKRLRALGKQLIAEGKSKDISSRLQIVAKEDSDGDGTPNQAELLLGHAPGDSKDRPTKRELASLTRREALFAQFLKTYRWEPFQSVRQPPIPTAAARRESASSEWRAKASDVLRSARSARADDGKPSARSWPRNPIDSFVAAEHRSRGLTPRPEAPRHILLRRLYLDLIGLTPTLQEQRDFVADNSADAYEKVVDRLLNDSRYGERWGRHWMDVWRYSDWAGWTDGGQIRDSKPHIWRWRDWIVESLNNDKGYDQMLVEMLAADELAPENSNALRATGFLVRNYKMLSREQWMEDCVKHTSQAFLGVTVGCAKCHNHMFDPISQKDYYNLRAIFEPHQVRTDRLPGQLDIAKDGLVRVFDTNTNAPTYFFPRGDERRPDTNQIMQPGVPPALCGSTAIVRTSGTLNSKPIPLPRLAAHPDKREFVIHDALHAAEAETDSARQKYELLVRSAAAPAVPSSLRPEILAGLREIFGPETNNTANPARELAVAKASLAVAEARLAALRAVLRVEALEDGGKKNSDDWKDAARAALDAQRKQAKAEAEDKLVLARGVEAAAQVKVEAAKKSGTNEKEAKDAADKAAKLLETAKKMLADAEKALGQAEADLKKELTTDYKPRSTSDYPESSTGRRLAFARWLTDRQNPLTARVAVNHIWARHFGQGIVPTPNDFGANGRPPSHPALLDWLAGEFMRGNWSMKQLHRLIVTSSTYRMLSTRDDANAKIDPDNIYLWRMPSRRMEAELVRDNLLYVSGNLDLTMGGPDIDHKLGLVSKRRSVYLRTAAEKEVEFLKIFDNASVTECYFRKPSVMPQQALALANSELALNQAQTLSEKLLAASHDDPDQFITLAFAQILARPPKPEEIRLCRNFLFNDQSPVANYQLPADQPLIPVSARTGNTSLNSSKRSRALILVLFNHNDFVSVR
jgi:hypothetical protein